MLVKVTQPEIVADYGVIPVGASNYAIVDPEDFERLKKYKWHVHRFGSTYYAAREVKSKNSTFHVYMHRQIMHTPRGKVVHHINGNGMYNRKKNLLNCTKQEHNFFH